MRQNLRLNLPRPQLPTWTAVNVVWGCLGTLLLERFRIPEQFQPTTKQVFGQASGGQTHSSLLHCAKETAAQKQVNGSGCEDIILPNYWANLFPSTWDKWPEFTTAVQPWKGWAADWDVSWPLPVEQICCLLRRFLASLTAWGNGLGAFFLLRVVSMPKWGSSKASPFIHTVTPEKNKQIGK